MREMTEAQWRTFALEGTRTGKVAVTRSDGRPLVVPIWFVLDGDAPVFMTSGQSLKGRSLLRDGRICMCVDDERPPYAFVRFDGRAEVSEDLDEMLVWSTLISHRYMGADQAEEYGRRNAVKGELLVRLRPERVVALDGIAE